MNLVGKLKEQVKNADNIEEAKKEIFNAGMEPSDEEVSEVVGGLPESRVTRPPQPRFYKCKNCGLQWQSKVNKCNCGCTEIIPKLVY